MVEAACGRMIHLSEITCISGKPFTDVDGLAAELANPGDPAVTLWVKVDGEVYQINTDNQFNGDSMGIEMVSFSQYNEPPKPEKVKRMIVDTWADIHHTKYKNYFGNLD